LQIPISLLIYSCNFGGKGRKRRKKQRKGKKNKKKKEREILLK
jgi:hypothetical protein